MYVSEFNFQDKHIQYFWDKIDICEKEHCWIWRGAKNNRRKSGIFGMSTGSGQTETFASHRVAFYLFYKQINELQHIRMSCKNKLCCNPHHMSQYKINKNKQRSSEALARRHTKKIKKRKEKRAEGKYRTRDIRRSYIKNDKDNKRDNDITTEFINSIINNGCTYCGEHNIMILTLDRVDNTLGHLQSNVNLCCTRCNTIKNNMPHEAWEFIMPTIKQAREKGLFGTWISGRYQYLENIPT